MVKPPLTYKAELEDDNPCRSEGFYTEKGPLKCKSAQDVLKKFTEQAPPHPIDYVKDDELLKDKLIQFLHNLDEDLLSYGEEILKNLCNGSTASGKLRYIVEALYNNYSSAGINEEVLKKILPFDNFQDLHGIDFGFGNGEIPQILKSMGANMVGLEGNVIFAQKARNKGMHAYVLEIDCPPPQFKATLSSFLPCDFVISTLTLDRLYNPKNFVINFLSSLKKGGRFALQTLLPIEGIDEEGTDNTIIYTPEANKLTPGRNIEEDKLSLVSSLSELGANQIEVYQIPYCVTSCYGIQTYNVWSFCGTINEVPSL